MILGPVSLIDCVVFCIFLVPQLLLQVGIVGTIQAALNVLPFLVFQLPFELLEERWWRHQASRTSFAKHHTLFEDLVIRCVRYAFAHLPSSIGRVFFSKWVSLPFMRWRMLKHGYLRCPVYWRECMIGEGKRQSRGVWIKHQPDQPPDMVVYYVHGGGFAMGSCYFYLEFLLTWHHLLVESGYRNPAIFALDYALVPDEVYPEQVNETITGYKHVLDSVHDSSQICVAGDSAGGALVLSLLLELAGGKNKKKTVGASVRTAGSQVAALGLPQMAALISPWVTLKTSIHYPSHIDYLDRSTLWEYALEYAGSDMIQKPPASPGSCDDPSTWRAASPHRGYYVTYGDEEVLAPDIEDFIYRQRQAKVEIQGMRFVDETHAWPVASLFLSSPAQKRLKGLRAIVGEISRRLAVKPENNG